MNSSFNHKWYMSSNSLPSGIPESSFLENRKFQTWILLLQYLVNITLFLKSISFGKHIAKENPVKSKFPSHRSLTSSCLSKVQVSYMPLRGIIWTVSPAVIQHMCS